MRYKQLTALLCTLSLFSFFAFTSATHSKDQIWESSWQTSFRVASWKDNLNDEGLQIYNVSSGAMRKDDVTLGLSTGAIYAEASSSVPELNGNITTFLDSVVSGSWTFWRTRALERQWTFVVDGDVSLPTGTSRLSGREKNVIFDPLLARFDRYGEGLNASIGAFAGIEITSELGVSFGAKHTVTTEYVPDAEAFEIEINPGDTTAFLGELIWKDQMTIATLEIEYSLQSAARRNGQEIFERAPSWSVSASLQQQFSQRWAGAAVGAYTTRGRDTRLDELTGLSLKEADRRSGDYYSALIQLSYLTNGFGVLSLAGDYTNVGDSDFDDASFEYLPAREKWRIGLTTEYALSPWTNLQGELRYFEYEDKGSALLLPLTAEGYEAGVTLITRL